MRAPRATLPALLLVACSRPTPPAASGVPPASEPAPSRHPSDGQGRLELRGPTSMEASSIQSFALVFTAGDDGIATGGGVLLQVSPFWGWSEPQDRSPGAPGYVSIESSSSADLRLELRGLHQVLARVHAGRVAPGETVTFHYGPARVDRFAERGEHFLAKVDGNGDAFYAALAEHPMVEITPGPAARLALTLSSFPDPAGTHELTVAALDAAENRATGYGGVVRLEGPPGIAGLPASCAFGEGDAGARRFQVRLPAAPGAGSTFTISARDAEASLEGRSNPASAAPLPVDGVLLWGDLHGHSNLSDGTGTPEDYYRYAREISALDVAALTDHDAHGREAMDERPAMWDRVRAAARDAHEPGRFVTFAGFEWTSWTWGHKHVLDAGDDAPLLSMRSPGSDTPEGLWSALRDREAVTISHHPGGGPKAADWSRHDPTVEPIVEIASIHGISELPGAPRAIYHPVPGSFVTDALARGHRLGFVGSGDTHNGHPGQGDPSSPTSGLAGILARGRTREDVLEALRTRRTFATTGARIVVLFWVGETFMGQTAMLEAGRPVPYRALVWATDRIERVEIVRGGKVVAEARPSDNVAVVEGQDEGVPAGWGYHYARVTQWDEEQAWSSPVFHEAR